MTLQGVSGELSAPQRRNLSRIDANARHLLTLINEILDITRIEAGRMPIQIVAFNLRRAGPRGDDRARADHCEVGLAGRLQAAAQTAYACAPIVRR